MAWCNRKVFVRTTPRSSRAGFTFVELLVAMTIIGLLTAVTVPSFLNSRKKARNEVRRADLKTIQIALEKYYAVNKRYPTTCAAPTMDGTTQCSMTTFNNNNPRWFYSCVTTCTGGLGARSNNGGNWVPALVPGGYLAELPADPHNDRTVGSVSSSNGACANNTNIYYRYRSNGFNYKLQAYCGMEGTLVASSDEMANPSDSADASARSIMVTSAPQQASAPACPTGGATAQLRHDSPACW